MQRNSQRSAVVRPQLRLLHGLRQLKERLSILLSCENSNHDGRALDIKSAQGLDDSEESTSWA